MTTGSRTRAGAWRKARQRVRAARPLHARVQACACTPPTRPPTPPNPTCRRRANGTLRCLPFFHILGVSKCGTTDMYHRLSKHPQMFESLNKVCGERVCV
jgi:hypothetical protein